MNEYFVIISKFSKIQLKKLQWEKSKTDTELKEQLSNLENVVKQEKDTFLNSENEYLQKISVLENKLNEVQDTNQVYSTRLSTYEDKESDWNNNKKVHEMKESELNTMVLSLQSEMSTLQTRHNEEKQKHLIEDEQTSNLINELKLEIENNKQSFENVQKQLLKRTESRYNYDYDEQAY